MWHLQENLLIENNIYLGFTNLLNFLESKRSQNSALSRFFPENAHNSDPSPTQRQL